MNLREKLYEIGMTYDELDRNSLPYEVFIPMDTSLYPIIPKNKFMISNKGRIYDCHKKEFKKISLPKNEDTSVSYYTVNIGDEKYLVHRLMLSSFEHLGDIELMKTLHVDHKDGNKHNNELYNLRWATNKENTIYARDLGLLNPRRGETHPCATITEKQAREICELLSTGKYSKSQISKMLNVPYDAVCGIYMGVSWVWISKDYNVQNKLIKGSGYPKVFTFDQLHMICKYFSENKKPDDMSVRKYCLNTLHSIGYDENIITEGVLNGVRSIYNKKRYIEITSQYNW